MRIQSTVTRHRMYVPRDRLGDKYEQILFDPLSKSQKVINFSDYHLFF